MPRKIPQHIKQLLNDEVWLIEKHVTQRFSITELAAELNVTPNVIRRALRSFQIVSPTQQQLREASNLRKYGVANTGALKDVRKKSLVTMNERYGGHNWAKGNRTKRDATCLERFGDVNVSKTEYAKQKIAETNKTRYGRLHFNQVSFSLDTYEKLTDPVWLYHQHITLRKPVLAIAKELGDVNESSVRGALVRADITPAVYNFKVPFEVHKKLTDHTWMLDQQHVQAKTCAQIAKELDVDPWTVARRFHEADIEIKIHPFSEGEKAVGDFIESLGVQISRNSRKIIPPKELDIYVPSRNIAIEFCGVYWHGENQGKYRTYHKEKHTACKEKGIQLLTIYDWEWNNRQLQVEQKIRSLLGKNNSEVTYARKCSVICLPTSQKSEFFEKYHIQGSGPGSINYGLIFDDELVAAISIIKTNNEYIINRYASKNRVVGGFSKLLRHFQQNHDWRRIISFADLRWSDGHMYETLGFKLESEIPPDYAYIINSRPMHKFAFRHSALKNKLLNYDPTKSEWENMKNHGYDRIWDCGKLRYVIEK